MSSLKPVDISCDDSSWVPTPPCSIQYVTFLCLSVSQRHAQSIGSVVANAIGSTAISRAPAHGPSTATVATASDASDDRRKPQARSDICDISAHLDIDRNQRPHAAPWCFACAAAYPVRRAKKLIATVQPVTRSF